MFNFLSVRRLPPLSRSEEAADSSPPPPSRSEGAAGSPSLPPSRSEGAAVKSLLRQCFHPSNDEGDTPEPSVSDLKFEGPAPPGPSPSMKAGKPDCIDCLNNLIATRIDLNKRYAIQRKKRKKKKLMPAQTAVLNHTYNTRSKRLRLLPPLRGTDVPGANFPT